MDLSFSPSWTQEIDMTRCRISPSRLLGPKKSSWRDAGSLLFAFLDPRSRVDEMPDLSFSPSWTQEVELTRCRIATSRLLGPKKLTCRDAESLLLAFLDPRSQVWWDARSLLLAFLDPRSRVDEMDLSFSPSWTQEIDMTRCRISPSWTQEVELMRCQISPSHLLGPKKSSWRDFSFLLAFLDPRSRVDEMDLSFSPSCPKKSSWRDAGSLLLAFLEPRSRVDEMPDLAFSPSWNQEVEFDEMPDLSFSPSCPKKSSWRDAGSLLLAFLEPRSRVDEMPDLAFSPSCPKMSRLTRCRISPSRLLGTKKSSWRDAGSRLLAFLSQEVELTRCRISPSRLPWNQEVELTRCRISPSRLLGTKKSSWRDAGSRLLAFLSQEVELTRCRNLAFSPSWTQEVELTRCRISPSRLLVPRSRADEMPDLSFSAFLEPRSWVDEMPDLAFLDPRKLSWRDAGSLLLALLEPRSRVDEMPDLSFSPSWNQEVEVDEMPDLAFSPSRLLVPRSRADEMPDLSFSPSWNQEVELTRCRISPSWKPRSRVDEMPDLAFSPSWNQEVELTRFRISPRLLGTKKSSWRDAGSRLLAFLSQEVELTRCRISPSHLLGTKKSSWRDAGSRLHAFLEPRGQVDEMPDLAFSPSWTQEVELTRCRISPSRLLGPKKSSWRDAGSLLLAFLDPGSWVDEMSDLSFSSFVNQEVELTRCRISPSRFLGTKKSSWRDAGSLLLALLDPGSRGWRDAGSLLLAFLEPRSRVDEMPDLSFSPSWNQEVELTRCRISPSRLLGTKRSSWRDAGSRLLAFLDPRSRVDEVPDLSFSPSWNQEVELTRCRISPSRPLGPRKSSWRDAGSLFLAFLEPRSRVDEMPDLSFLPSWNPEVELTRCRISPSRLLGTKKSSWRDAGSRLLSFVDPRSRVDEMPDLSFSLSWNQEVELARCRISPFRLLGTKQVEKTRHYFVISLVLLSFRTTLINVLLSNVVGLPFWNLMNEIAKSQLHHNIGWSCDPTPMEVQTFCVAECINWYNQTVILWNVVKLHCGFSVVDLKNHSKLNKQTNHNIGGCCENARMSQT